MTLEDEIRRQAEELQRRLQEQIYGSGSYQGGGNQYQAPPQGQPSRRDFMKFMATGVALAAIARVVPPRAAADGIEGPREFMVVAGRNGDIRIRRSRKLPPSDVIVLGTLVVRDGFKLRNPPVFEFLPAPEAES